MKNFTLLKQTSILSFASLTILLTPFASNALTVEEVTNPRQNNGGWVTDMADILSSSTEAELNSLITNLEQNNGAEIAVVTVPETTPANSPKTFATQLFNHWEIGKAESNNGILFLVSIGDKRVEIETGKGIANTLTDAQVANIIDTRITPQYKHDNFDRGTLDGTKALISSLDGTITEKNSRFNLVAIGIVIASIGGFIWSKSKPQQVLIDPSQAIINLDREDDRNVCCAKCKQPMQEVENVKLTKVQQVAKKIGSVKYRGYKCSNCSDSLQPYSLIAYISNSSRYQKCPRCQEFTVTRTEKILKQASHTYKGKKSLKGTCHYCQNTWETIAIVPRKRRPTHTSSSSSYSGRYGGSSGSSGGSGFGGGSSDGGGAGGDF